MLQRASTLLIIVFWLTMTGLLVRNEVSPSLSRMREVPVSHVLRRLFLPEQANNLNITSDGVLLGRLTLTPRVDPMTGLRVLGFNTSALQVRTSAKSRQRIRLEGEMQLDDAMELQRFNFAVELTEPTAIRTEVSIEPAANRAHVVLRSQGLPRGPWQTFDEHEYTLDQAGARELLGEMGLDPSLLTTRSAPKIAPTVRARMSSLLFHGELVETSLLTVEQSGQTLMEIHISQLGNVLQAKTLLGYNFAPDEVIP